MGTIASQITSLTIVYSPVYSYVDQRKHQISASLAFVWGIHRGPVNFPHKRPVTRKMFPFDDVIMKPVFLWTVGSGCYMISRIQDETHFMNATKWLCIDMLVEDYNDSITITMTSEWAWWRLKSPASRLFTQPFIRAQIKVNIKAPRHWPLCGEFTGDRWIPRTQGQ